MIGIYHNRDLDGFTSGAIIKRKYPDAKMIGYDYGQPFDFNLIDGPVIMADVSMPLNAMQEIATRSGYLFTWIDHHISAINQFKDQLDSMQILGVLDNTVSACEATWAWLFPEEPMPPAIKLLGEYDTWRNGDKEKWDEEILPFQFGMRMLCNSLDTFPQHLFYNYDPDIQQIIEKGRTILKYQSQQNEFACRKSSFEQEFENLRAICLNGGGFNSDVFKSVYDEAKHDVMMPFVFNGKFWVISLYTTKDIDCSEVAKRHGGGGHKKAAGFQVNDIRTIFKSIFNE